MDYNIYIKLTNGCNLKCKHCYNTIMHDCKMMQDETIKNIKKWLLDFSNSHSNDRLDVQLHGGEPMLFSKNKILDLVDSCQANNIKWGITTNLVYELSEDVLNVFKRMLPYDETPFIMTSWDYKIRFQNNTLDEDTWINNVKFLESNNIKVQPIVCVTNLLIKDKSPIDLFKYFQNLGINNVNFERLTRTGNASDGKLCPLNREIDDWLFEAYLRSKEFNIHVPLFESIEDSVRGFLNGCRARHCMKSVITINPDGSVSTCPNCADKKIAFLENGKIIDSDIDLRKNLEKSEIKRNNNCYICNKFKYCNGDCCQLQYDESGCPGLIKIYDYLLKNNN